MKKFSLFSFDPTDSEKISIIQSRIISISSYFWKKSMD